MLPLVCGNVDCTGFTVVPFPSVTVTKSGPRFSTWCCSTRGFSALLSDVLLYCCSYGVKVRVRVGGRGIFFILSFRYTQDVKTPDETIPGGKIRTKHTTKSTALRDTALCPILWIGAEHNVKDRSVTGSAVRGTGKNVKSLA